MSRKFEAISLLIGSLAMGVIVNVDDHADFTVGIIAAAAKLPVVGGGAIYYVSPQGNDTNPGSEALPFHTIQRAVEVVQPGDLVYVRAGTYNEFSIPTSGSPGLPIIFRAYPGEQPLVNSSRSDLYGVIGIHNASYIVIDGFAVRGGLVGIQIEGQNGAYNQILNCDVSLAVGTGIGIYRNAHDNLVKNCRVYDNVRGNWPRGIAYVKGTYWGAGLVAAHGSTNNVFEGNYVYWNHGEGTSAINTSNGTVWRRNVIADNWSGNLYVDGSKECVVDNNLVYLSSEAKTWPTAAPERYNWSNSLGISISVEEYPESWGARGVDNLRITNNIVFNANGGVWAFQNNGPYVASGWLIANNTFVNNDRGIFLGGGVSFQSNSIRNNIVYQGNGGEVVAINQPEQNNIFSHNLYFASKAEAFYWGTTSTDFIGWKGHAGEASSLWRDPALQQAAATPPRFWSDPSLPSPIAILPLASLITSYNLTANSPAIDAGVVIPGLDIDCNGIPRPQGKGWDIGAFEFAIDTQPPAPPSNVRVR